MKSLTGVWHGLYSYPVFVEPVYFAVTLIQSGLAFSGTIHESEKGAHGTPLTRYANVSGAVDEARVEFIKTYDGSGGWNHAVSYLGSLNAQASEIEGFWTVSESWSGKFLMIRSRHATEAMVRRVFEKV